MIASFLHKLRRLAADQSGNATIEFVIWFPIYLFLLVAGLEMGSASWRNAALETALDRTARELRLPSSTPMQHAEIKAAICDKTVLISNCAENLRLEMVVLDPNNWVDPAAPSCTDTIAPVAPLHKFTNGVSERVVLLRACAQYRPYLPLSSFGQAMTDGNDGWARVTATSAYVQAQ